MLHLIPLRTFKKAITFQDTERSYFVHFPSGYDNNKKYPLVVMLHGYSDSPRLMELYSGMSRKADKEKFIVVYPKGLSDTHDRHLSWSAGFCCGAAARAHSDDVAFIDQLLDEVSTQYAVDTKKVYIAGFSNGAMFAHLLGTHLHAKVAAIAAIAGCIGSDTAYLQNKGFPVPILIMNGRADRTIPFTGGGGYASVTETVNFWKSNNKSTQEYVSKEKFYDKTIYSDSEGRNEVAFYEIYDGKHLWFGRKRESVALLLNKPIFTTEEVWDFFKKH
ncbi:MAG: hypothetical protein H0W89_00630 [Candidatus Levybacteria bacterium]|nr:hypothetical protein [Candidatus Levybacteria bacterium]